MQLDFSNERVLAVVAHPDDAELLCAGTLARARSDGAAIGICVLCCGEKGQPQKPVANLSKVRRREMTAAARLLGAPIFWGGFADATLVDDRARRLKLVEIFRAFNPTLILAHFPQDYHSDHRAASALAEAASWSCASKGEKTRSSPLMRPPCVWWMDTLGMMEFVPGFYIDISKHVTLKEKMLQCHRSQLARENDRDFTDLRHLMRLQFQSRGMQAGVLAAEAFRMHHAFKRTCAW